MSGPRACAVRGIAACFWTPAAALPPRARNGLPEERRPAQLQGLVALLQRLHAEYPDLQLFFNRGFEALPELGFAPAAVAVESLEASWDQAQGRYGRVSESDRAWLDGQLKPLLDAGTPVVAIENSW